MQPRLELNAIPATARTHARSRHRGLLALLLMIQGRPKRARSDGTPKTKPIEVKVLYNNRLGRLYGVRRGAITLFDETKPIEVKA